MKRLLHIGFMLFLGTALIFVFLLVLLLSSSRFNRWLILQLDAQVPELSIAKIDGLLLGELHLRNIKYQSEQVTVSIESLTYQYRLADLLAQRIQFDSLQATGVDVLLHNSAEEDSELGTIEFVMPIALQVQDFSVHKLRIKQNETDYLIEKLNLALLYQAQQLQISQLSLDSEMIQLQGKAELQVGNQFPFNMDLELVKAVPELADVKAHVFMHGDSQKIYLDTEVLSPSKVYAHAWVDLGETVPRFDLQLNWPTLQWPLQGDKQYASENARLTLQGNAEHYSVIFDSELFAKGLSAGQLHIEGQGNAEQLTLNTLLLKALEGDLLAKGSISWTETTPSYIQLQANKLQLASVVPDYPGEISLDAEISGQLFNKPDFGVQIKQLQGVILGKKLQASGQIHYSPEQTSIKKIQASIGANRIDVQGQLGKRNSLTFKLDAADLQSLSPDLTGSVYAEGVVQGEFRQPVIKFNLHANEVGYQEQQAANIQARAAIDTSGAGQLDLKLTASQIVVNGKQIEKLELQSIGQNAHHELRAQVLSEQAKLEFAMQGAWNPVRNAWQGQIQQLFVQDGSLGSWQMIKASPLKVALSDQQSVQLETELCLAQKKGVGLLCINAQAEPSGQKLEGTIKQLPLSVFADWMPTAVKVNSHLHSEFSVFIQEKLHGDVHVTLDPGVMVVQDEGRVVQRLNFKMAQFDAQLSAGQMKSNLSFILNDANYVKGTLEVHDLMDTATARINGLLNIQLDEIGFISAFTDSVSDIGGNIKAELQLHGLLKAPSFNNSWLRLDKGSLNIEDAGLLVQDLNIELTHSEIEQILLRASADIEGQALLVDGQIDQYTSDQLRFKLAMNGENLPLLQLPEMQAWLSPELHLTGDKRGARLGGHIAVPKAILVFQTLPEGAVELSSDEVIISDEKIKVKEPGYLVDMDVLVKLGKAVSIEGFGLKARLEGQLHVLQEKNNLKLFNELNLLDGTYQAYGQDLTLEKGQLLFAGNMQNPGVNILASRKASDWDDKTIAFMSMTGTLNNLVTRIYTEPASSDSESLAYLLTGAPMSKGGADSAGLLAKAALSLGRDYVDAVMGSVGIDEFDIKSTTLGQNSMVVGKRIAPNLYARYIMDILTAQMQFAVEYKFTENISIETRAGSTHSSDIKYNIEFD